MQFKENADVLTSDGQKLGRIDRVVIDPESKQLTHVVVKKGFLFTEDKVVPVDHIDATTEDQVTLKRGAGNPDELPDFEATHYIPAYEGDKTTRRDIGTVRPVTWYYPVPGAPWWRVSTDPRYAKSPYVRTTEINIPDGTVPLEEGAKVVSSDGKHVGDVERIYSEPEEDRVTHLLISKGLISTEKRLIPTMWVDSVFEDQVRLSVGNNFIESLPTYSPSD